MNKKVADVIEGLKKDIAKRQNMLAEMQELPLNLIQEAFPEGRWYITWIDQYEFIMPYVQASFQTVKDFMKDQLPEYQPGRDFQVVWDTGGGSAGMFLRYKKGELSFDFAFRSGEQGSTCVMNKIGEKLTPVFEVVCGQEAAAEFNKE